MGYAQLGFSSGLEIRLSRTATVSSNKALLKLEYFFPHLLCKHGHKDPDIIKR